VQRIKLFNKGSKNKNPPILVYVKQEPIDTVYTRTIEQSSDGTRNFVVIDPETPTKAGWRIDVTGCIRNSTEGLYCEAIRGATKAIQIDIEHREYNLSKLTNDQMQEFINFKIFKAHYGQLLKDLLGALKPYLLIMAVAVIISCILGGYNAYTISKLPENIHLINPTPTPTGPGI
jgi:hypothetical protein